MKFDWQMAPHFSICANSATLKASVIHKPHKPNSICVYFAICRVQHFYDHQSVRQCRQRNSMCLTFLKPNNTIIVSNSCWIPVKSLQISIYPWFVILFDFFYFHRRKRSFVTSWFPKWHDILSLKSGTGLCVLNIRIYESCKSQKNASTQTLQMCVHSQFTLLKLERMYTDFLPFFASYYNSRINSETHDKWTRHTIAGRVCYKI